MAGLAVKLLHLYTLVLLVRVILSWIPHDEWHPLVRVINRLTEPVLAPLRRIIPPMGGIDVTPIVVMFLIEMIARRL